MEDSETPQKYSWLSFKKICRETNENSWEIWDFLVVHCERLCKLIWKEISHQTIKKQAFV